MGIKSNNEQRKNNRLPINSLTLPFLGTRVEDHQSFQYVILDTSQQGAGIAIPQWVMSRERVNLGERINLHLPFRFNHESYNCGTVTWEQWQEDIQSQRLGVHLDQKVPDYYPVLIDLTSGDMQVDLSDFYSEGELLLRVIKDAYLLKRGVKVYYSHLVPYFSRVAGLSKSDFNELRNIFLNDVGQRIAANLEGLEQLYQRASHTDLSGGNVAVFLDLEQLRVWVESEFYSELFNLALPGEMVSQYIMAIKTLEQRLFYNYNTAVMLYIRSVNMS